MQSLGFSPTQQALLAQKQPQDYTMRTESNAECFYVQTLTVHAYSTSYHHIGEQAQSSIVDLALCSSIEKGLWGLTSAEKKSVNSLKRFMLIFF